MPEITTKTIAILRNTDVPLILEKNHPADAGKNAPHPPVTGEAKPHFLSVPYPYVIYPVLPCRPIAAACEPVSLSA
jgi:hypothetical protein